MNKKEKRQEEEELQKIVRTMGAAIRLMAGRKAAMYELQFLHRMRELIDREIEVRETVDGWSAESVGKEITETLLG